MSQPIRILHLEDDPADALLVRDPFAEQGLGGGGPGCQLPGGISQGACRRSHGTWCCRIIVCPILTGWMRSRSSVKNFRCSAFILMSGNIGEQAAIESLKAGATDYILKSNRERLASRFAAP